MIGMHHKDGVVILLRSVILTALFVATNLIALAQSIPLGRIAEPRRPVPLDLPEESLDAGSFSRCASHKLEVPGEAYRPITSRQSLSWFTTSVVDPAHLAGVAFVSAFGTATNRPAEYGPHWRGFGDRFGIGMAGRIAGNAMEASAGLLLREDPRYFRAPQRPFKARVGNAVRLTFLARTGGGSFGPAYARYIAIVGSNFLSNSWRAPSDANAQNALLRSSEGFAGHMAANVFAEFWPDIKKRVFQKDSWPKHRPPEEAN